MGLIFLDVQRDHDIRAQWNQIMTLDFMEKYAFLVMVAICRGTFWCGALSS